MTSQERFQGGIIMDDGEFTRENQDNMNENLTIQSRNYFDSLYEKLSGWTLDSEQTREFIDHAVSKTSSILEVNNKIARYYRDPEYLKLKDEEKDQRGECAIGIIICIDGRISVPHLVDQSASVWETAAGILQLEESPIDGTASLKSKRLVRAIVERAQNPDKLPLLEILFAHTSLSDPEHGCGAMMAKRANGEYPDDADLVLENLKIHEQRAEAITNLYNANRHQSKEELKKAAITAVFDTDHMGIVLGYGSENQLSTTKLAASLFEDIKRGVSDDYGVVIPPGLFKENFSSVNVFLQKKRDIITINNFLLSNGKFLTAVQNQIDANFSDLTEEQKNALRYVVARNVSFQYVSGLYEDTEHHHHPFAHHGEGYQAVALDGITLGQHDPENQVFGACPSSAEEAIALIQTQCSLMDKIGAAEKPYVLFLSKTFAGDLTNGNRENEEGLLMETWTRVLKDEGIRNKVVNGELIVVPVLISAGTREIIDIPNFVGKK